MMVTFHLMRIPVRMASTTGGASYLIHAQFGLTESQFNKSALCHWRLIEMSGQ